MRADVAVVGATLGAEGTRRFDTRAIRGQPQRGVLDALGVDDDVLVRTRLVAVPR